VISYAVYPLTYGKINLPHFFLHQLRSFLIFSRGVLKSFLKPHRRPRQQRIEILAYVVGFLRLVIEVQEIVPALLASVVPILYKVVGVHEGAAFLGNFLLNVRRFVPPQTHTRDILPYRFWNGVTLETMARENYAAQFVPMEDKE
jgi:hypothetical protein